jgi:hypothetical protein
MISVLPEEEINVTRLKQKPQLHSVSKKSLILDIKCIHIYFKKIIIYTALK